MARKSVSGTVKTAPEIKRAIVLREAGYSLSSIADKTGISTPALARHFKKHGVGKGSISARAIEEAKKELIADGFAESLKSEITAAILDDLSQYKALRAALSINIDELLNDDTLAPHYRSRGLTAAATGLRLSQELIRKALQIDDAPIEEAELPTLTIMELTPEEIAEMRAKQITLYDQAETNTPPNNIVEES